MAWLEGWDKRIEFAIGDYAGDIGGSVTWFPVDVFLTATQAEEVFVELTTDAEYKKIQFTQNDGTSLLYGHMKLFDVSEELGIFAVSATGWTINANTSVWMYYDKDHADNDTYIGATNTAACEAVYNAEFDAVYPMDDGADTSHIYDATDNNNDGTKKDANEPAEVAGKVGQGQDFAGDDDYINTGSTFQSTFQGSFTFEAWVKQDDGQPGATGCPIGIRDATDWVYILLANTFPGKLYAMYMADSNGIEVLTDSVVFSDGQETWHHIVLVGDSTVGGVGGLLLYLDGAVQALDAIMNGDTSGITFANYAGTLNVWLGMRNRATPALPYAGIEDEVRISSAVRSAAWIKGTYNSGDDVLFTYGSEETEAVEVNALFFGANF